MSKINETPTWENSVYAVTTETAVLGRDTETGADGPANLPVQQLANRTLMLRQQVDGLQTGETPYVSVTEAQRAINEGRIPAGALFSVRTEDSFFWVQEYQNVAGKATPTGKFLVSSRAVAPVIMPSDDDPDGTILGIEATRHDQFFFVLADNVQTNTTAVYCYKNNNGIAELTSEFAKTEAVDEALRNVTHDGSDDLFRVVDAGNNVGFRVTGSHEIINDLVLIAQDDILSGNIGIRNEPEIDNDGVYLSDGLGTYVPIVAGGEDSGTDPGEVTVNLPPQTGAYALLSKMRAALEDVCIIINSDSTGVSSATDADGSKFYKWPYKLAQFLGDSYPAYTVNYYSWSTSLGAYNSPVTLQVGSAGKTLYFYNAAVAGTQPLYLMGQFFETAYVPRQADLLIFNHGHNTDYNVPSAVHAGMSLATVYQMLSRHTAAGVVMFSQNPLRDSDQGASRSNGTRQAAIAAGFSLVDVYQLFLNAGRPVDWYADNIHPSSIGDTKIFELVRDLFVWPASPSLHLPGLALGGDLVPNADFTAWPEGNAAPDGWALIGCTAEKDQANFDSGSWGMKLVANGVGEAYAACALPSGLVRKLRGKTVYLACLVYVPTTSTRAYCGYMSIPEASSNRPYGITTPNGRGGFVWKGTIATIPLNATALTVRAGLDVAGAAAGDWCTFDRLPLVIGNIPQDFH